MNTYIALLRGINVGGQKKIKMANLKKMMESLSFQSVRTYIQSGNVVFVSDEINNKKLSANIQQSIYTTFGFEVAVLVLTAGELQGILNANTFKEAEDINKRQVYYALLASEPTKDAVATLRQTDYPHELFHIHKNCIFLNCLNGAGKAKLTNTILEKKLGVVATTRNHRTMIKLIELATA